MANKLKYLLIFIITIIVIVLLNFVGSKVYTRFDLTAEKRFTLTDETVAALESLTDSVNIQVFLGGEVPLSFNRMRRETEDMLRQFEDISDGFINYEFVDLKADGEAKEKEYNKLLARFGIKPYTMKQKGDKGEMVQMRVYPCALVGNKQKATGVKLLQTKTGASLDQMLHTSLQNLEYELLNAVKKLNQSKRSRIAFISNKSCLTYYESIGALSVLKEHYDVVRKPLTDSVGSFDLYDVVIVPGPEQKFTEPEKLVLDQYVMQGGSILWLIDQVNVPYDSLAFMPTVMALPRDLNIDDMLFKYGVRVNRNLVLDSKCAQIPVNIAPEGERADFKPAPWYFFPLIEPDANHPITKNLDLIRSQFVSQIDTVGNSHAIKKSVLLETSYYTRVQAPPFQVNFGILSIAPDERFFKDYKQIVGVLLEGKFPSVFTGRPLPKGELPEGFRLKTESDSARQIIIADGDIFKNDYRLKAYDTLPFPLGLDKYTKQVYGNKSFLLNSVNYLCGETDLMNLRARELQNRLLNKSRIAEERSWWQILNVAMPVLAVILAGFIIFMIKRWKYKR